MRVYEVILDGVLATDLTDSPVPLRRHDTGGATVLRFRWFPTTPSRASCPCWSPWASA